jgi:hypothetical protein
MRTGEATVPPTSLHRRTVSHPLLRGLSIAWNGHLVRGGFPPMPPSSLISRACLQRGRMEILARGIFQP